MDNSQLNMVLNYLKEHNSITDREAYNLYGIRRLSAIIYVLRHNQGYNIETIDTTAPNRFGVKTTFATYVLVE